MPVYERRPSDQNVALKRLASTWTRIGLRRSFTPRESAAIRRISRVAPVGAQGMRHA